MKLPNFGYHRARWEGNLRRKAYWALLPTIVRRRVPLARTLPLDVYSYSDEAMLPEQVRSIYSFLRYAGHPKSFTVVSDGTHSSQSIRLLNKIDPVVSVRPVEDFRPTQLPARFLSYLATHPQGKQLGLVMSLPQGRPAFYMDSDVLLFPGAVGLSRDATANGAPALYLSDCRECSADLRLFRDPDEARSPVNCGLMILFRPLDWSVGIDRFLELKGEPEFFTNQTLIHLVMHANGSRPLDQERYVLQLDDQFIYPDCYAGSQIVLRHYVNPVRHKFWNAR